MSVDSDNRSYRYVAVLGSCCTADALVPRMMEDLGGTPFRVVSYRGRTSFASMVSPPLEPNEFSLKELIQSSDQWAYRMVADEAAKTHIARLTEIAPLADALIIDHISAFIFPVQASDDERKLFLMSWEWERYVEAPGLTHTRRLWEVPLQRTVVGACEELAMLHRRNPHVKFLFHHPAPSFANGVQFADVETARRVGFYQQFCAAILDAARTQFANVAVLECEPGIADPNHHNGPNPFHFTSRYADALRREVSRCLRL
jgi:hypothetical protein